MKKKIKEQEKKHKEVSKFIEKTGKVKVNRMTHNLFEPTQLSGIEIFQIEEEEEIVKEEDDDEI